jgi:hypothetical protein
MQYKLHFLLKYLCLQLSMIQDIQLKEMETGISSLVPMLTKVHAMYASWY